MLETFKIITDKVNVNKDAIFKFNVMPTRGHQYKVSKPISTKLVRAQCFSHRVINDWNSLPQEVVSVQTVNEFKTKLDQCWKEHQYITPFE